MSGLSDLGMLRVSAENLSLDCGRASERNLFAPHRPVLQVSRQRTTAIVSKETSSMILQTPALGELFLILSESQEHHVSILMAIGYHRKQGRA